MNRAPCPFHHEAKHTSRFCCALLAKGVEAELEHLDLPGFVTAMHSDLRCDEARALGVRFRTLYRRFEDKYANQKEQFCGAPRVGRWNEAGRDWEFTERSTYDEALNSLWEAANWYEAVGNLGFGAYASY